jgi:hypothetical protein
MIHDPERDLLRGDVGAAMPDPADLAACDAAYQQWRTLHLASLDEAYAVWRQTGARRFPEDFDAWRQARRELQVEQSSAGLPLVAATDEAPEATKAALLFERS